MLKIKTRANGKLTTFGQQLIDFCLYNNYFILLKAYFFRKYMYNFCIQFKYYKNPFDRFNFKTLDILKSRFFLSLNFFDRKLLLYGSHTALDQGL